VLVAALCLAVVLAGRGDRTRQALSSEGRPATAVRVLGLDVKHFMHIEGPAGLAADRPAGLLGEGSFVTRQGDSVEVEAELSQPAYAYLIAFSPDGAEEVCYPDNADEPPAQSDRLRYPPPSKPGYNYGLDEGEGLQAFAVVASNRQLPAYGEWRRRRGRDVWAKHAPSPGVVWQDLGDGMLAFTSDHPRNERARDREVVGKTALSALTGALRQAPEVETVATIAFAVLSGKKKR
jgi:hypothetical protein